MLNITIEMLHGGNNTIYMASYAVNRYIFSLGSLEWLLCISAAIYIIYIYSLPDQVSMKKRGT